MKDTQNIFLSLSGAQLLWRSFLDNEGRMYHAAVSCACHDEYTHMVYEVRPVRAEPPLCRDELALAWVVAGDFVNGQGDLKLPDLGYASMEEAMMVCQVAENGYYEKALKERRKSR